MDYDIIERKPSSPIATSLLGVSALCMLLAIVVSIHAGEFSLFNLVAQVLALAIYFGVREVQDRIAYVSEIDARIAAADRYGVTGSISTVTPPSIAKATIVPSA